MQSGRCVPNTTQNFQLGVTDWNTPHSDIHIDTRKRHGRQIVSRKTNISIHPSRNSVSSPLHSPSITSAMLDSDTKSNTRHMQHSHPTAITTPHDTVRKNYLSSSSPCFAAIGPPNSHQVSECGNDRPSLGTSAVV